MVSVQFDLFMHRRTQIRFN